MNNMIINKISKVLKKSIEKEKKQSLKIENLLDAVKYAQDIIDTVREPFLVLNDSLHVVTANPAFYSMFKVVKKDTEGTLVYELGDRQWDIPKLRKLLEDVLPKKKIFNDFEVTHDFQSIGEKTMLLNARRIDHSPLILLAIEDITMQKQYADLKESNEKRFRALIEKSADAIALVNLAGKVSYASPSTKSVIGYTPKEFQKQTNPFDLVPPDERETVTQLFEKLLKKPGSSEHVVYRIEHKNGSLVWIESVMTNLINDPNVKAIVINYRDVSVRKELETQKDNFIGIASHELKTPVTIIKAYTQILQKRFEKLGDEAANQSLAKMNAQINKLNTLIGDLLDITKIETGEIVFNKVMFDFDSLLKETLEDVQLTSDKHDIKLRGVVNKQVYADRERIGLILVNLLTNAIKYSPKSKDIIVQSSIDKSNVVVGVQDFGIGIPRESFHAVFDRFFRVKTPKGDTFPGLGLGLYISAEIIKRHKGKMWIISQVGKGSTFYFSIPINGKQKTKILKKDGRNKK